MSYSNKNHLECTVRFTMAARPWVYVVVIILLPEIVILSEKVKESDRDKVQDEEKIDLKHAKDKYKLKGKSSDLNLPRFLLILIERFLC